MTTQAELIVTLETLTTQVGKIGNETRSLLLRITELLEQLSNETLSPEVTAAVAALTAQVAVVDELVADLPPAP